MKYVSDIKLTKKYRLMSEACQRYKMAYAMEQYLERISERGDKKMTARFWYNIKKAQSIFESIVADLPSDQREYIFSEFIEDKRRMVEMSDDSYSKNGYYRMQHLAMESFLERYYA